ncbi:unnamed protein product [Ambrosiozyma monospora]|uniref:Unnamed protein product n=1 Tax=Ambrosiozyma monospora TaxID=43982 RepID=A0A9W6YWW9_AMBMO|nr:unnamed protein product [Ambrosiozyma monospora]
MVYPLLPSFTTTAELTNSNSKFGFINQAQIPFPQNANELADCIKVCNFSKFGKIYINFTSCSNVSKIDELNDETIDSILKLLNNGAAAIITTCQIGALIKAKIPNARLVYQVNSIQEVSKLEDSQAGVVFTAGAGVGVGADNDVVVVPSADEVSKINNHGKRLIFVDLTSASVKDLKKNSLESVSSGLIPIVLSTNLTIEYEYEKVNGASSIIPVVEFLTPLLKSDRSDGLFTTLVTDENNQTLGLVYSSTKSISEAIKTQTGVYQSRKHGLWYKGATSGSTQQLVSLDLDCDSDCLKFEVIQSGTGFCHLDTDSCFGVNGGLVKLEKVLRDRLANAPEGSYTKRLFDDEKLLNAKIKEEAEELTDAVDKDEIAWECADLFYFALTRCVKYGVSLADVERNLDVKSLKVTRRKGDAKPKFIEKEDASKTTAAKATVSAPVPLLLQ